MSKPEIFYELQHPLYGCMNPRCRFVYTEDEVKTDEFQSYLVNHTYGSSAPELYKLEAKVWTLDDVLNIKEISGWTPKYDLMDNGFELVREIDLYELFDGLKWETDSKGFRTKPWHPDIDHNLDEKKDELEKTLENLDYKNRVLLIIRTTRCGLVNWDVIEIFSTGIYIEKKEEIRQKLTTHWLKEQKKEEIEKEKRIAYNKAHGIEIPDFDTTKKRFNEFIKGDHPENFLFDPYSNTGYDMESVEHRKRLYQDVTKRGKKNSR